MLHKKVDSVARVLENAQTNLQILYRRSQDNQGVINLGGLGTPEIKSNPEELTLAFKHATDSIGSYDTDFAHFPIKNGQVEKVSPGAFVCSFLDGFDETQGFTDLAHYVNATASLDK